ncbi:TIGR03620 family F420-dependent LLM class oxidoreductase [Sphaerisporangium corydalis]|uniref:TIGR03620 family F420-dependent LLM class oxidoreductase n=1 Tax=Sphaerisporangium corydalis TaxID=1441875 RepID=A0ABV9EHV5_9ACTN|nr:TIGR03620 family F420-dependent LLM class oxidoreductase [Sphaerisporangium corydalis]
MHKGRLDLGRVGVWTFAFDGQPAATVREAAAEIEELGYGALWFGEGFGRDAIGQSWLLLSATQRMIIATGIASIERRDPTAMAAGERSINEAYPGRFLLGLGGHRVNDAALQAVPSRGSAVRTVTEYLDAMDASPLNSPAPAAPPQRVLAALGPKMLGLAAARAWGAHPYFVPVEHTRRAREIMGPDAFLAVEQAVVLDADVARAREVATEHVAFYASAAPHQQANLRRLGFGDADMTGGVSGRLVDAIVAYGDLPAIAGRVREHFEAGADHVCLQVLTPDPTALPLPEWRELSVLCER